MVLGQNQVPPSSHRGTWFLISTGFLLLNFQYPLLLSHGLVIGSPGSHSSSSSLSSAANFFTIPQERLSSSLLVAVRYFYSRLLFALVWLSPLAAKSCFPTLSSSVFGLHWSTTLPDPPPAWPPWEPSDLSGLKPGGTPWEGSLWK